MAALVGVRVLTGALSPAQYGRLALALTLATTTQLTILSPASSAILRFFSPAVEARALRPYLAGVARLLVQATAVYAVAAAVFVVVLPPLHGRSWLPHVLLALLFSLVSGHQAAVATLHIANRRRAVVATHQALGAWLRYIAAFALLTAFGASSSSLALVGFCLASLVALCSETFFLWRILKPSLERGTSDNGLAARTWTGKMRSYAWPYSTWGLVAGIQDASDRWALQLSLNAASVGRYQAVYQLGYFPIFTASAAFQQLLLPIVFRMAGNADDPDRLMSTQRLLWRLVGCYLVGTAALTCMAYIFRGQVMTLLTPPSYRAAAPLLPLLVLSGGLFGTAQLASVLLLTRFQTRQLIFPRVTSSGIGVASAFILTHYLGLLGAALSNIVFSMVFCGWMIALAHRQSRDERPPSRTT